MAILGVDRILNDSHAANPGAIALGSEVPVGAQIALVFARWAAAGVDSPLNALDASFGDAVILGSSDEPSSHCAFAYIEIDDWGSDHTISPSFLVDTQTPNVRRVFDLVFLSGLDTSSLGNWLRDWDFDRSGASSVASVEIDTEEDDIVLAALGQWEDTPDEPLETTTLIDSETTGNNRVRLVQLDEPESGTAEFSTGTSYPSVVAASIIPAPLLTQAGFRFYNDDGVEG